MTGRYEGSRKEEDAAPDSKEEDSARSKVVGARDEEFPI